MAGMTKPPEDLMTNFIKTLDRLERAIFLINTAEMHQARNELVRLYGELLREVGALYERAEWEESMSRLRSMKDYAGDQRQE